MLITFETKPYGDITFFGDVGKRLLKIMGQRADVPGAIPPEQVGAALDRLREAVRQERMAADTAAESEDNDEPVIGLRQRAVPLVELLEAAKEAEAHVTWKEGWSLT